MKIHIIGGPGSGKTTLARIMSNHLGCNTLHLDDVAYNNGDFDSPTAREYRLNQVSRFTRQEHWIIEGVYFSWVGSSFKHCDRIIVLSLDKELRRNNILKKLSIRKNLTIEQLAKQKARLLKSNDEYDDLFKSRVSGFLKKFESKVVKVDGCEFDPQELLLSAKVASSKQATWGGEFESHNC
jgi:adenylate kinase family enzyme